MLSSKYLFALICLPFSVGVTAASVPTIGGRPLSSGRFIIIAANDATRSLEFFSPGSGDNAIVDFNPKPSQANQQWSFIATEAPDTFHIQNGVSPKSFLSYPSAPNPGSIQFEQAVIDNAPIAFVVREFSPGVTAASVPTIGGRPLSSGRFNIIAANDATRSLDFFSPGAGDNAVVVFNPNPSKANQQWSFIATGAPDTFQIQNGVSTTSFLSYPSAPNPGPIQFEQAVIHSAPIAFVVRELSPGSPFFNISTNGFFLTYWTAPIPNIASPVTFETQLSPFQAWTLIPGYMISSKYLLVLICLPAFSVGVTPAGVRPLTTGRFNISILFNGFALTYWPAPNSGFPDPLTFESPGGALAPFQNWTLVAAPNSGFPDPLTFEPPGGALAPFQNWTLVAVHEEFTQDRSSTSL
ncbi:hypothetical protein BD410DRAFT_898673 [Rickenella mellea]|uniref:Ricin B lectin domain-containing protein n=1 Tax=Rickenella mellea TaxID=50990 RepID=A0A4Y7Q333_9AGAM|nr:hypothetical protein BD410DRAFT_898673 [Rickenella mellea]